MCGVEWAYDQLRIGGRGKHVGAFGYYHSCVVAARPSVAVYLDALCREFDPLFHPFNVVKLDRRSRVSFLRYEDFDAPFPALLAALSCDVERGTCRRTDYAGRRNPPILHRKELLLPADDPRVGDAERLTQRLEAAGAFVDTKSIGTRDGWHRRLAELGVKGVAP